MPPKRVNCQHVIISDEELKSGVTSLDNIQAGVEEFHKHGFVVFENAIPLDIIDKFYEKMSADGAKKLEDPTTFFNSGKERTNFSISPPLSKEWLVEDMWANKHAAAVMEAIFGKPQLTYAGSNINRPTQDMTSRQAVHVDSYYEHHKFTVCIELFMYLHDVSPDNGSTEIWPGSHHEYDIKNLVPHGRGWVKPSVFKRRAEHSPPFQPTIPRGSIAIRDLRLWHAGMPNPSENWRIMVGFIYFPRWYRNPMRITLPKNCRPILQKWTHVDAVGATNFVDGEIDHLSPEMGSLVQLNFTQDPETGIKQIREKIDISQGREPNEMLIPTAKDYWTPGGGLKKFSKRLSRGGVGGRGRKGSKGKQKSPVRPKVQTSPLKPKFSGVKKEGEGKGK